MEKHITDRYQKTNGRNVHQQDHKKENEILPQCQRNYDWYDDCLGS